MRPLERVALATVWLAGCGQPREPAYAPAVPAASPSAPTAVATNSPTAQPEAVAHPDFGQPLRGPPRLVVENHAGSDLQLYQARIVDVAGVLGTQPLWPHPSECKEARAARPLPKLGIAEVAAPTHAFDESRCAPGRQLAPGRYIVQFDSGYGSETYAAATLTLPLTEPVRLKMENHKDSPPCTPERAQRAARLGLAAAKDAKVAEQILGQCDAKTSTCAPLPLPDDAPPSGCTLTLHETLLRIRFPLGSGPNKQITTWFDPEIVLPRHPDLSLSSAEEFQVGGKRVVVEGITRHHMHEHGGDAAQIGTMVVRVHNASTRPLTWEALSVEFLSDHSCGTPTEVRARPALQGNQPTSVPPGTSDISIEFAPQAAYQAHCDIFATRAKLRINGRDLQIRSEHAVTRIEPMRH